IPAPYRIKAPVVLKKLLKLNGNDPKKAMAALERMQKANLFRFAAITLGEEDFDEHGSLRADAVYRQFLGEVGSFSDEKLPLLKAFFIAQLVGRKANDTIDTTLLYDVAYATSWQTTRNKVIQDMGWRFTWLPFVRLLEANSRARTLS